MSKIFLHIIISLLIMLSFSSCQLYNRLFSGFTETEQEMDKSVDMDSIVVSNLDSVVYDLDGEIIDPMELIELAKLDSTSQLLEYANQFLNSDQPMMSGYWFALAKVMLASVNKDNATEYLDYHRDLIEEVNKFYASYVSGIDVLPVESSQEIIMAGIDEAEADSTSEALDTLSTASDSLQLVVELVEKPVVEYDSSALTALLDTVTALPPVPLVTNRKVNNAIKFFQNKGRKVYEKWMERGNTFIPSILPILQKEGLPDDIVFLAMIESGFNPKAYSYAHASGPWQFISSTGRIFGLEVGWWYDERRDSQKSTLAAAKYLKKLYTEFDDWYLALASYNCGEGRVRRQVRNLGSKDFWRMKRLPRQTRNYVPTYIAAVMIAHDPVKYGFKEWEFVSPKPVDSVLITECIDLELIAKFTESDYDEIVRLNPPITKWCTPPDRDATWIYLPAGSKTDIADELKAVPKEKKRRWTRHTVRNGEALSTIARKYGTTVWAICDVKENKIKNRNRIKAGKVLLVPVPPDKYKKVARSSAPFTPPSDRKKTYYTVRRGDNLSVIAARFHTSISSLRKWNKLYRKRFIHPGQRLVVWTKPGYAQKSPARNSSNAPYKQSLIGPNSNSHTVKKGENAWDIARKYKVSHSQLLSLNGLARKSVIRPGDKLLIPEYLAEDKPAGAKTNNQLNSSGNYYTVRRGDTLWDISIKYKTSIKELKKLNQINNHKKIKPGDKLKLPG
jgi:membrane-bound lytic murein transglycosylase D